MAVEQNKSKTAAPAAHSDGIASDSERQRSTIEFPYGDLDDAIAIAKAMHGQGSTSCSRPQLAAWMGQSMNSGAFNTRLGTARIFNVIDTERGAINLTEIGRRIVDPGQERAARVDAFLSVPLYRRLFDENNGHVLPPRPKGLEHAMAKMGVAPKQTDRARQAFERSAQQAGFFAAGAERLVMPALPQGGNASSETPPSPSQSGSARESRGGGGGKYHLLLEGLFQTVPEPFTEWSIEDQVRWLRAAAGAFSLLYPARGDITVEVHGETIKK